MLEKLKKYAVQALIVLLLLIVYVGIRIFVFPLLGFGKDGDLKTELDIADGTLPFTMEGAGFTFERITYDDALNVTFHVGFTLEKLNNHFDDETLRKAFEENRLNNVFCGMKIVRAVYEQDGTVTARVHGIGHDESVSVPLECTKQTTK